MKCKECDFENPSDSHFCSKCGFELPTEEEDLTVTKLFYTPVFDLPIGSTFAERYQIIEELGRGGMGKVYKVLDKEIDEKIALKVLKPEISGDEKLIERFRNELKFARKISHHNVCRMYDLMKEKLIYFITMEYVSGEDLKNTIIRVGQLSEGKTLIIAKQICKGLAEAHRLGVVHRDMKPQNVMIDREGDVRIMDFGIARSLKSAGITETGVMIGTPEYMSPEQAMGEEVDQRSDIYSLGVILFELVTGSLPFCGDTAVSIALKQKTDSPPNPRSLNALLSEGLNDLILKCMEKNKNKRFQSVEEVQSELTKIEKGMPTTEKILPEKQTSVETPRKRKRSFAAPGFFLLVIMICVAGFFLYKQWQGSKTNESEAVPIQKGLLEVDGEPKGAKIYLGDDLKGDAPLLDLELPNGNYEIKISYPQYQEKTENVEIIAGEKSRVEYQLDPWYILEITTDPTGASVNIDGIPKGTTGATPLEIKWPKNTCSLKIEKKGWAVLEESITLESGINPIKRSLKKSKVVPIQKGLLEVDGEPKGAKIYLDDDLKGDAPLKDLELPNGNYEIKISHPQYQEKTENVEIIAGEKSAVSYHLDPWYILEITTNPTGASVIIDGIPKGTTGRAPLEIKWPKNTCSLKIEKKGWAVLEESITLESGINPIKRSLKKSRYDTKESLAEVKIRISVYPYADVIIDDRPIGRVPPIRTQPIEVGQHTIVFISESMNKTLTIKVEIKLGENKEVHMNMETGEHTIRKFISNSSFDKN